MWHDFEFVCVEIELDHLQKATQIERIVVETWQRNPLNGYFLAKRADILVWVEIPISFENVYNACL